MESTIKWHACKDDLPPENVMYDYLVAVKDDFGNQVVLALWDTNEAFDPEGEYKTVKFYNFHPYDDIWEGQRCEITHWAEVPSYPSEKSDLKNLDDYKARLKDYLIDKFSSADEDKPSMISVAALLRNELLREIYNDIVNDRI